MHSTGARHFTTHALHLSSCFFVLTIAAPACAGHAHAVSSWLVRSAQARVVSVRRMLLPAGLHPCLH